MNIQLTKMNHYHRSFYSKRTKTKVAFCILYLYAAPWWRKDQRLTLNSPPSGAKNVNNAKSRTAVWHGTFRIWILTSGVA